MYGTLQVYRNKDLQTSWGKLRITHQVYEQGLHKIFFILGGTGICSQTRELIHEVVHRNEH